MMKIVVGLLDSQAEAQKAVEELANSGFRREDIGMLVVAPGADKIVNDAAKGVFLGSLAGLLIGAATMMIPGIGWVMVAGPVGTILLGTALGAAAGGVIGALRSKGVPEKDAQFYAEGVRRGGVLITVSARTDESAKRAEEILKRHGAVDLDERREQWQAEERKPEERKPEERTGESEVPVAAVSVYNVVIEAEAPAEASYAGPERRKQSAAYAGMDRRQTA
jgi:hypothetical protein